ncbi:FAD-dependent oxidoreductase, partial [Desulfobacter sp.]|uniref:FAD-dependent oxidoreductase n=1 Tax=Desulfobacter sp. TaxID=2294 RepID=UPI003D0ACAA0
NDYIENGWELKDTLRISPLLEQAWVAYIHVSGGVYGSTELTIPSMYTPQGCFIHMAEAVKQVVNVPVITVGRIKDPAMANAAIRDGKADMVALGRSIIADPEYPNKAKAGNASLIRPCVGCCLGCIHAVLAKEPGSCVVNPDVGREYKLAGEKRPEKSRKILVAGAGPSGLAAARMFAQSGHQVKIYEKGPGQGGLLALAATAPGRGELGDILRFFRNELERLNVAVNYNTPLSSELLASFDPDHVILATGSMPDMPVIKGLFKSKMALITSVDVFTGAQPPGDRVIVLGGGFTGLITAHKLGDQGKEVVVLNRKKSFAEEMSSNDRYYLRERLKACGVTLYKTVTIKSFTDDGVIFTSRGEPVTLEGFDTVVISEKHQPVRDARHLEKQSRAKFHMIGDAKTPRHLMFCVAEAEEAGRSI